MLILFFVINLLAFVISVSLGGKELTLYLRLLSIEIVFGVFLGLPYILHDWDNLIWSWMPAIFTGIMVTEFIDEYNEN